MTRAEKILLALAAPLLFFTAFSWPGSAGITGTKLDDSYPLVLEDAARRGAVFGTDLIYTHGPLGYLYHSPGLGGFRWQRLAYGIFRAAFSTYICLVLFVRAPLRLRIAVFVWLIAQPPTLTWLYAGVGARLLHPPASAAWRRAEIWVLPAVLGFCGMVKFTELLAGALVVLAVAAVFAWEGRWKKGVQAVGVFALTAFVVWVAAGQPPDALPRYLANCWQVSVGFATMTVAPKPEVLACALAGVAAILASAALAAWAAPRRLSRTLAVLPVLGCAFLSWKHGFVRADNHVSTFFTAVAPYVALLFAGVARHQWWQDALVGTTLAIGIAGMKLHGFVASDTMPGLARVFPFVFPNSKDAPTNGEIVKDQRLIREQAQLPRIKAAAGHTSVDIFNYQQAYAFINDLTYHPRPVFQSYAAYTPRLQQLNLDFYLSPRRPSLALFFAESADGRWHWLDDAPLTLHLLTDWEPIERELGFILMQPSADAPRGEWRELASGEAPWGSVNNVPDHPPGSAVALTIEECRRSAQGKIKRFFYQGANLRLSLSTPTAIYTGFNFVPEMAAHRVLLSPYLPTIDDIIGFQTGAYPAPQIIRFNLAPWEGHENEFEPRYRFKLWLWTPRPPRNAAALAERGRSLLFPYLPGIPEKVAPNLSPFIVNGGETGRALPPCRIDLRVPPGTRGINGRAVLSRTDPTTEGTRILTQLYNKDGKLIAGGEVTPGTGKVCAVRIEVDFPPGSTDDGQCVLVLGATASPNDRPFVIWGPLRWK